VNRRAAAPPLGQSMLAAPTVGVSPDPRAATSTWAVGPSVIPLTAPSSSRYQSTTNLAVSLTVPGIFMGIGFQASQQSRRNPGDAVHSVPACCSYKPLFRAIRASSPLPPFVRQHRAPPATPLHDLQRLDGRGEMLAKVRDFRAKLPFGHPSPQIFDTHGASPGERHGWLAEYGIEPWPMPSNGGPGATHRDYPCLDGASAALFHSFPAARRAATAASLRRPCRRQFNLNLDYCSWHRRRSAGGRRRPAGNPVIQRARSQQLQRLLHVPRLTGHKTRTGFVPRPSKTSSTASAAPPGWR
jgi:hypothetical protein